jgi:hypothetical protein
MPYIATGKIVVSYHLNFRLGDGIKESEPEGGSNAQVYPVIYFFINIG